ncbi:ABC transporter substrate-binding protein [Acinetobacter sp. MD2(2019)]|uniref:ABC transporter substrate-binding protein n=1 Tax=Acinetobacter sp. MD2(2019) TaxID=2605273 RepID=UPI002D1E7F95|nr:ABC transporter substrate-binding protein [Acinetobacter sp. MD2(2019)]MEB3754962.1 ABC transporter substrate-binding protein [Acinetobacter sp. MD2(2019)]
MATLSKRNRLIWIIPTLILVALLLFIFKPSSPAPLNTTNQNEKIVKIRIAVPDLSSSERHSSGAPLVDYIYLNQLLEKEFSSKNIQIEWQFFKGAGPVINEALANKQLDFAFLGDLAAIIGKSNQIDTTLLMATGRHIDAYLGVLPNKGYTSLEKLRGKRIAIFQGTAMQLSFDQYIERYGFTEKDFRIINLDPAAANAALAAKQIDASWGLMSILALKQQKIVEVPQSTGQRQDGAGTIQSGLVGRSEFIQQHPELTQALVNTVLQSAYWVSQPENRNDAIQLVTKNAGLPIELYAFSLQNKALKTVYSPLLDEYYLEHLQQGVQTALNAKLIKRNVDVKQWQNSEFVDKGLEYLNYINYWEEESK